MYIYKIVKLLNLRVILKSYATFANDLRMNPYLFLYRH